MYLCTHVLLVLLFVGTPALSQVARWTAYPELFKIVLTPPDEAKRNDTEALFGYSVTYLPTSKSLIISSPTADNVGQLFTCDIDLNKCIKIRIPKIHRFEVIPHDYWLGATVKAGSSFFMVCAPRAIRNISIYGTFGSCYSYHQHVGRLMLTALVDRDTIKEDARKQHPGESLKPEYTMDSFGWSMEVADDDTTLVGGPAMSIGRVMVYSKGFQNIPKLIDVDNSVFSKTNGSVSFNFGYSIASGNFFNETTYAVSSPYGDIGKGKVLFFNSDLRYLEATIVSDGVGSLFGAALCAARLGGGGGAALLVGAPAFAPVAEPGHSPRDQVGAVHVYHSHEMTKMRQLRTIAGFKEGSYFGHAIANVGDLNGDGKDEVVIAAPYEGEGRGAVYVYSGVELYKHEEDFPEVNYLQKIMGDSPGQNLGVSLSALKDHDENGCNELAIGIPGANKVMLLRCMASVSIHVHAQFQDLTNHSEDFFILQPCLNVTYSDKPKNIHTEIFVRVDVSHPNVTVAEEDMTFVARLEERLPAYCTNITVTTPDDGDYDQPILFNITTTYEDPKTFDPSRVFVSAHSNRTLTGMVRAPGSNLTFLLTTTLLDGYVIGSTASETITVRVRNFGRVAYGACVRVRVRGAAVRAPAHCARAPAAGDHVQCVLQEPLAKFDSRTSDFTLETDSMTSDSESVAIDAQLFTSCQHPAGAAHHKVISLRRDVQGVAVKGATNPGAIVNVTKTELTFGFQNIQHVYTITNKGVTNWGEIKCDVTLPPQVSSSVSIDTIKECPTTNNNIATCTVNQLQKNDIINIIIAIYIQPGTTKDHILSTNSSILTHLSLQLGTEQKSYSVSTQINVLDAEVPLWIIIVAAFVGFIILLITAWILHECGCLQRKNKEKLLKLKKEVKRQSIRRSMKLRESMIVAVANQIADDRQKLVALQEETDASCSADQCTAGHADGHVVTHTGNQIVTRADIH